ncbi:uncharacterized protein LOC107024342 isoform X2 [Solanum pennellii]|uniref:Uncharacterized protein LOC107024342 isoform X2 n=1 Tax=Solanum pennellii TaxID=28526 RepID=A0ABM1H5X1_SOLPN|nr:uncharacterized protein LOC107024342 isoform X2 [Solanum pennellii]
MFSSLNTVEMPMVPRFIQTQNRLKDLLLIFSTLVIFYLIFLLHHIHTPKTSFNPNPNFSKTLSISTNLSISHLFFSIAASSSSFSNRLSYINLWYKPNSTNAVVFLDDPISISTLSVSSPPILVSSDTSKFPYSFPAGRRSAIRIARIVKDTFDLVKNVNLNDTRWFVFGDDDTVFFTDNLVRVLSKYDCEKWYYVGYNSESFEQNEKYSFDMAFGGGGFALSAPLAKVLARVLDSCLIRYPHLYGSDSRIFSCVAELGVHLTHEPGFHQVFEGNQLLPDLLSLQRTFTPWKRGKNVSASYMLNTRVNPSDPCKKPDVFFLKKVLSSIDGIWTEYTRHSVGNCVRRNPTKKLVNIRVFSQKLDFDVEQLKAPRRPCCDISAPINETMIVGIRQCGHDELISMQT